MFSEIGDFENAIVSFQLASILIQNFPRQKANEYDILLYKLAESQFVIKYIQQEKYSADHILLRAKAKEEAGLIYH